MAMHQHSARVADDEHRANRLSFAPFPTDVHRQIHDRLKRVERHTGFDLAEVAGGEGWARIVLLLLPACGCCCGGGCCSVDGDGIASASTTDPMCRNDPASVMPAT